MVSDVLGLLGLLVVSYLLGGISFGYLYARFVKRVDIRTVGSGNVGATNVARLYSARWRIPVFLIVFTVVNAAAFRSATALRASRAITGTATVACAVSFVILTVNSARNDVTSLVMLMLLIVTALVAEHAVLKHRRPSPGPTLDPSTKQ